MTTEKTVKKSKAEKRLERKAEKARKKPTSLFVAAEKSVSQIAQPAPKEKQAHTAEVPEPIADRLMRYETSLHDNVGSWSWGVSRDWGVQAWETIIKPHLEACAVRPWRDIRSDRVSNGPKHHEYEIHVICAEAYKRLVDLNLDDQDHIFRFRLDGKKRLYGFLFAEVFKTVWYDPTHQIYPVEKGGSGVRAQQQRAKAAKDRQRQHLKAKEASLAPN